MSVFNLKKSNNLLSVCSYVLNRYKVKFTERRLKELLESNVDYPSLLSIKDALGEYAIQSAALRKGDNSYDDFELPFICSVQKEGWSNSQFTVVSKADNNSITYLEPLTDKINTLTFVEFSYIDKGVVLLLDGSGAKNEIGYVQNRKMERTEEFSGKLPLYISLLILIVSLLLLFSQGISKLTLIGGAFLCTSLFGSFISALLIKLDVNSQDPFIKEVCGMLGKKSNCEAVLSSSRSKFMDISWSVWGLAYFATFFISQLIFFSQASNLTIWSLTSIIITPYLIFSIYYQARVIQQWCPLCLGSQFVILVNACLGIVFLINNDFKFEQINHLQLILNIFLGIIFLLASNLSIPILKRANDSKEYEMKWKKLLYNPTIFASILEKSETINYPVNGIGLVIGNESAANEIVKVCNPYCQPCSSTHLILEEIVRKNSNVKLRIIFTASGDERDIKTAPVQHLLAIQEKYGKQKVHEALDDWYLASVKKYDAFAVKYPMNGELNRQTEKVLEMRNWCEAMKIRATPTLYINGKELPEIYSPIDLKYFF
ncbi:vitamin K epoxide reductase family protein [Sphingobacterium sp. UBA7253]|nr:vitamin K epoxide reductase family protein [Sphingobacterium sp. UBA7253]